MNPVHRGHRGWPGRLLSAAGASLIVGLATGLSAPAAHAADVNTFEQEVVRLVNQERAALGRSALVPEDRLWSASEAHADWMAASQIMSHVDLNGKGPVDRVLAAGYTKYTSVGETVAQGYTTPAAVVAGWKGSPGHWQILTDPRYRDIGVGYVYGSGRLHWWAVDVGNSVDTPWPVTGSPSEPSRPPSTSVPVRPTATSVPVRPTALPTGLPPAPKSPMPGGVRGRVLLDARSSAAGVAIIVDGALRLNTPSSGAFEISGLTPGRHTFDARMTGFLSRRVMVMIASGTLLDFGTTTLKAGDVVADDRIDLRDLVSMSNALGHCRNTPGFQPLCDLNQSGCVNNDDYNLLRRNYGLVGPLVWGR